MEIFRGFNLFEFDHNIETNSQLLIPEKLREDKKLEVAKTWSLFPIIFIY